MKKFAVRNLRLCTKDCLCLYVCPFGATDTENSIIDINKCNGCGACVEACPSKAISLVPYEYPPQQVKKDNISKKLNNIVKNKLEIAKEALAISKSSEATSLNKLTNAIVKSSIIMSEDLLRESGYMLPQSNNSHVFLNKLLELYPDDNYIKERVEKLLKLIPNND